MRARRALPGGRLDAQNAHRILLRGLMIRAAATFVAFFVAAATPALAQPYSSIRNGDVVQLLYAFRLN